jgi:hypothetical protein
MSDTLWGKPVVVVDSIAAGSVKVGLLDDGAISFHRSKHPQADVTRVQCRKCNATIALIEENRDGTGKTFTRATELCGYCATQEFRAK